MFHDINISEMGFALHLQPHMVGVTGVSGRYKMTPDFWKSLGDIPELAPVYPSMENLLAANTDFLFAGWGYGLHPGGDVTPETLARYGIPVYILTESCVRVDRTQPRASMDLLFKDILSLGKIFGEDEEAEALVAGWKRRLEFVAKAVSGRPSVRVFVYDSGEDRPLTAASRAMPTAIIEAAGGHNIINDVHESWTRVSWEDVALRNPQFLILLDYQKGTGARGLFEFLQHHPAMKTTDAVRNHRFLPLHYEQLTPGPANIEAVEALATALHPESFPSR
ncbi:MAG: ABC transporter substrate-binding protein [Rhodospirillaceae bacterium]|nr:ABC transporter substrate-binding protein [Rhodospirillaceae bacterium]